MNVFIFLLPLLFVTPSVFASEENNSSCVSEERTEGGDFRNEYRGSVYQDIYKDGILVSSIHLYDYENTYGSTFNENKAAPQEIATALHTFCSH